MGQTLMWRYGTHKLSVRGGAIVLSVAVHGTFFWHYSDTFWSKQAAAERPAIVARLSLPAEAPATKESRLESKQLAEAKPPVKSLPKPKSKPLPKQEVLQPLPVAEVSKPAEPEPRHKSQPKPVEQFAEPEPAPQADALTGLAVAEPVAPIVGEQISDEEALEALQHYLAELRAAIAAHKQYPALARRRGIEGEVKVSFTLLADGSVRDLRVSGGPRPLRSAAKQAVHSAVQLPPPPAGVPSPMPVKYAMNFSLR